MLTIQYVFVVGFVICGTFATRQFKDIFVTRPNSPICPYNAVCGDIFEFERRLDDGTRQPERRHITNCFCRDTGTCNFDPGYTLYQSKIHSKASLGLPCPVYRIQICRTSNSSSLKCNMESWDILQEALCNPVSELQKCQPGMTARRMHIQSADFNGKTYFEILCKCPRSLFPPSSRGVKLTTFRRYRFEGFSMAHDYECSFRDESDRDVLENN